MHNKRLLFLPQFFFRCCSHSFSLRFCFAETENERRHLSSRVQSIANDEPNNRVIEWRIGKRKRESKVERSWICLSLCPLSSLCLFWKWFIDDQKEQSLLHYQFVTFVSIIMRSKSFSIGIHPTWTWTITDINGGFYVSLRYDNFDNNFIQEFLSFLSLSLNTQKLCCFLSQHNAVIQCTTSINLLNVVTHKRRLLSCSSAAALVRNTRTPHERLCSTHRVN